MLRLTFTPVFCVILLAGCGQGNHEHLDHAEKQALEHSQDHSEHHEAASEGLQLNAGQRWEADTKTTAHIMSMQAMMVSFDGNSYEALSDTLQGTFQQIFQDCSMTGEAHEQLHHFLVPMIDLMENVGSDDSAEAREAYAELKEHLGEYGTYFQ